MAIDTLPCCSRLRSHLQFGTRGRISKPQTGGVGARERREELRVGDTARCGRRMTSAICPASASIRRASSPHQDDRAVGMADHIQRLVPAVRRGEFAADSACDTRGPLDAFAERLRQSAFLWPGLRLRGPACFAVWGILAWAASTDVRRRLPWCLGHGRPAPGYLVQPSRRPRGFPQPGSKTA